MTNPPDADLAFFDLDETVTDCDTDMLWSLWRLRKDPLMGLRELVSLVSLNRDYYRGTLSGERYMRYQKFRIRGLEPQEYDVRAERFFHEKGKRHIYPEAAQIISSYRDRGVPTVMLTAQNRVIASRFARDLGMDEVLGNAFTVNGGRFSDAVEPYCFREGKIYWAEKCAGSRNIPLENCAFFSDSHNDIPLLSLVGHPVAVNPDGPLEEKARQSGWTIMKFTRGKNY
ncbi:MAG TPA: HAD-IB family hydrolase [Spirochaetota bacterium]|nr:HAD-IB family hydrolase [Spirochaetota bacterium]HPI91099.1 HAD-IB family hydrolase [Spirochaetota bacterium]HPR49634.1 HAD-IB family hydrolase [Spirochaetota bacterium]